MPTSLSRGSAPFLLDGEVPLDSDGGASQTYHSIHMQDFTVEDGNDRLLAQGGHALQFRGGRFTLSLPVL